MPDPFELDRLFRRYPHWPIVREAARSWQRELARGQAATMPLTGAFYWVPIPVGDKQVKWEVQEFFDAWLPSSDHAEVWLHVRDSLELHWKRDLSSVEYCCLPRGRVCQSQVRGSSGRRQKQLAIYHGGDGPLNPESFDLVRAKFNLDSEPMIAWDDHERMLPDDTAALATELSIDLRAALAGDAVVTSESFTMRIFNG